MKKVLIIIVFLIHSNLNAGENKKAYFAGGCFWCMEESFDQVEGVVSTISGYSGGHLKNPTYQDVIYKDTGHVEAIEITYDPKTINYEKLLNKQFMAMEKTVAAVNAQSGYLQSLAMMPQSGGNQS